MLVRAWNALAAVCSRIAATDPSGAGLRGWRRAVWELTATVWVFLTFVVKWRVFRRRRRQRREQLPRAPGTLLGSHRRRRVVTGTETVSSQGPVRGLPRAGAARVRARPR